MQLQLWFQRLRNHKFIFLAKVSSAGIYYLFGIKEAMQEDLVIRQVRNSVPVALICKGEDLERRLMLFADYIICCQDSQSYRQYVLKGSYLLVWTLQQR